jgi:hypothetical protein
MTMRRAFFKNYEIRDISPAHSTSLNLLAILIRLKGAAGC